MTPTASPSDSEIQARIASVPHWYHQIEVRPGIVTPGINASAEVLRQLTLPDRCEGMRVLDVGARDGYFSFELERRGAEVLALDYIPATETGFAVAKELMGSGVEYAVDNVYNVTPERYGTFDLILFLGVIYHLRDPLQALDRLWSVANDDATLVLETQLLDRAVLMGDGSFRALQEIDPVLDELCLMQFYPGDSLRGDPSNYWAPNAACARELMVAGGFEVTSESLEGTRGIFQGRRVDDPALTFHRRLEKTTLQEAREASGVSSVRSAASAPRPVPATTTDAPAPAGDDELARLQLALESAQQRARSIEDELAEARRHGASLEAELARRDGQRGVVPAGAALRATSASAVDHARSLARRARGVVARRRDPR